MQRTMVDATEFVPTPETLTRPSSPSSREVWSVVAKAGTSHPREVMDFQCVDEEHANALAELLRKCVGIDVDLKELD